jgi:hypothetical protein
LHSSIQDIDVDHSFILPVASFSLIKWPFSSQPHNTIYYSTQLRKKNNSIMARCRAKGKGKTKKAKDQQTKLSRWLGRSPSPESTPPPEVEERNARRNLR